MKKGRVVRRWGKKQNEHVVSRKGTKAHGRKDIRNVG